jgi:type II secretory pathway component PulM
VIVLCGTFLALAIGYAYIWLPLTREHDRLLARVPELRADAQAMKRDARELQELKGAAARSIGPAVAIQQAAAASGLGTPIEIARQDSTKIRVAVASARAGQAFGWLARLQSGPGVRIESIRLMSLEDGDRIRIEAIVNAAP